MQDRRKRKRFYPNRSLDEKTHKALEWLGERYVKHPEYKPREEHEATLKMIEKDTK